MKYAAIDIGSNAVRLLIANVIKRGDVITYKKDTLIRVPLRLGDDAFMHNQISKTKAEELIKTIRAFKLLMDVQKISSFRACATSAMRDALNGAALVKQIKNDCGVAIEIIKGKEEAEIIYSTHIEQLIDKRKSYLYIDVGGGSTELTLFHKGEVVASTSINIGTIRMLDNTDTKEDWDLLRRWVKEHTKYMRPIIGIGTGGNINKIHRLSGEKEEAPITYLKIKSIYNYLCSFSLRDRIQVLNLNQDRADVIIPAAEIYLTAMKLANIKEMYVPRVGLVDGMIVSLINENEEVIVDTLE